MSKEVLGEPSPGVSLARVTSNVLLLDAGVVAAVATTEVALDFYSEVISTK
jgi:hypothetical protein